MSLNGFLKIKTFGSGSPNNPIGEPRPFYILQNGVTVRLKGGLPPGTTGLADGDFSGKVYTAVSQTELTQLNKFTTDWSLICTTLCDSFSQLFASISLNPPISHFDTSNVNNLFQTFRFNPIFNTNIDYWDTSKVITMRELFRGCNEFNQPLNSWDVSECIEFSSALRTNSFNQPLNNWNPINAENMDFMFQGASSFNQNIDTWNVSSVEDMQAMFANCSIFNSPLNSWDTSNVTQMSFMFSNAASFNKDISSWCVEQIPFEPFAFALNSPLDNLPNFKPNWGATCGTINSPNKMTILTITN